MRPVLLAVLIASCGAAQRGVHSDTALSYDVAIDASLGAMRVTLCADASPLPSAIVPVHDEVTAHLRSISLVRDEQVVRSLPIARRIDLSSAPHDACVRYEVDLTTCTTPRGPAGCARVGGDLFAPTSVWLLAPETRARSAHYDVRFVLPEGVFVTPIDEGPSTDGRRLRLDDRNIEFVTYLAFVHERATTIAASGACIDVATLDGTLDASFDARSHWLDVAAQASSRVTGQTPFDRLTALVIPTRDVPNMPVLFGVAGRGMRPTVTLLVSEHATEEALVHDWTAVHELAHLLTAYVDGEDTWLSEGLATYYEEVLRARQGLLSETEAWTALTRGFARGRAASSSGTLRQACATMHASHAYTRVYWQGAALVLLADVAYRRAGSSLDAAIGRAWPHRTERATAARLLEWLDGEPDGTFAGIATASLDAEPFPDVDTALIWLGVSIDDAGIVSLDPEAPGAAARAALMNGDGRHPSNPATCDAPRQ